MIGSARKTSYASKSKATGNLPLRTNLTLTGFDYFGFGSKAGLRKAISDYLITDVMVKTKSLISNPKMIEQIKAGTEKVLDPKTNFPLLAEKSTDTNSKRVTDVEVIAEYLAGLGSKWAYGNASDNFEKAIAGQFTYFKAADFIPPDDKYTTSELSQYNNTKQNYILVDDYIDFVQEKLEKTLRNN